MRFPRTPARRAASSRRSMTPGAAGGHSDVVAPPPRDVRAMKSTPPASSAGGAAGAGILYSNGGQTIPFSAGTGELDERCFNVDSTVASSDVLPLVGGNVAVDTSTGRLRILEAGAFLVGAQVEWFGTGGTFRSIQIERDGVPPSSSPLVARSRVAQVGNYTCQSCIGLITAGPGDEFFVVAGHDSGSDQDVGGTAATQFWCVGVGDFGSAI